MKCEGKSGRQKSGPWCQWEDSASVGNPSGKRTEKRHMRKHLQTATKPKGTLTVLCKTQFRHHGGKSARKRSRSEGKSGGRMAGKVEWTDGRRQRKHRCRLWRVYLAPAFNIYLAHVQAVGNQFTLITSLTCCSPWGHKESDAAERLNNNRRGRFEWEKNVLEGQGGQWQVHCIGQVPSNLSQSHAVLALTIKEEQLNKEFSW